MMKTAHKYLFPIIILFLVAGVATAVCIKLFTSSDQSPESSDTQTPDMPEEPVAPAIPEFINLQPTVDAWLAGSGNGLNVGLMIYDLDHQQVAAAVNPDEVFNAASIYKLWFVYDGYMQIDSGLETLDDHFITLSDRGALTTGNCLDLMIRESFNGCADPMRADSARYHRVEQLIARLGLQHTSSAGLYTTAADLTELLKLYYQHPDLSATSWTLIQDSMLNQPATTYNWRQGLPSGFQVAKVYDKVGWNWNGSYWDPYDDAAIVTFEEQNRHYIMVVLTRYIPTNNPAPLVELGNRLETAILAGPIPLANE